MLSKITNFFVILTADAQVGGTIGNLPNPTGVRTLEDLLNKISGYLYKISIPLVTIMVIIGAIQLLFAGGNPEKVTTGKRTILYAVIGFAIIFLAGGLTSVIADLLSP
jgi:hypothetical protein